jgi:hypothetical protein
MMARVYPPASWRTGSSVASVAMRHARERKPQGIRARHHTQVAELHGLTLSSDGSEYGGLQVDLEGACGAR